MSRLFSPIHRLSERLFQRNYGWTGVEIGSHCINLAQVRKNENRWQLASVWTVEHPTPVSITPLSTATEPNSNRPDESFGWLTADELMEYGLAPSFEHLVNLSGLFRGLYDGLRFRRSTSRNI